MENTRKKDKRRRLILVTTTLACLISVDLWVRGMKPALREYDDNPFRRTISNLQRGPMPDIVLMGSSRAGYALLPEEFEAATGRRTGSAAVNGSEAMEWRLLARRLFAARRPRLVVLGINAHELSAGHTAARAARYLFDLSDVTEYLRRDQSSLEVVGNYLRQDLGSAWAMLDNRFETKMYLQERSAFILPRQAQMARKLRERVARPDRGDGGSSPHSLRSGQSPTLADRPAVDPSRAAAFPPPGCSPDAAAMSRLKALLAWFTERKIAVLVVYLPNSPITEERWRKIEPAMIDAIADLCRGCAVPFLRCDPEDVPRTNADFIGEFHVRLPLAQEISRRAARHVTVLGLLDGTGPRLAAVEEAEAEAP